MVTLNFMHRFSLSLILAALSALLISPIRVAADLIWTPQSGWQAQGGVLAGLGSDEGRNALDFMNKARAAEEAGQSSAALKAYTVVVKKYPNSIFAAEALYHTGLIYQKRQQYYKAFDTYQSMLGRYPNSEKFTQVIGEQYRIASSSRKVNAAASGVCFLASAIGRSPSSILRLWSAPPLTAITPRSLS